MGGTKEGGARSRATKLANDPNYYSKLGRMGGSVKNPKKGFGSVSKQKLREYGRRNGALNKKRT